jgi:hypothetical protein
MNRAAAAFVLGLAVGPWIAGTPGLSAQNRDRVGVALGEDQASPPCSTQGT